MIIIILKMPRKVFIYNCINRHSINPSKIDFLKLTFYKLILLSLITSKGMKKKIGKKERKSWGKRWKVSKYCMLYLVTRQMMPSYDSGEVSYTSSHLPILKHSISASQTLTDVRKNHLHTFRRNCDLFKLNMHHRKRIF